MRFMSAAEIKDFITKTGLLSYHEEELEFLIESMLVMDPNPSESDILLILHNRLALRVLEMHDRIKALESWQGSLSDRQRRM